MEKDNPDWLTTDFLNKCLQSKEKYAKCEVSSFTAELAVPPGNNYGSHILRVKVNYKQGNDGRERTLSLITKSPLVKGSIKDLYDQIYESEPVFYNQYLPIAYKLLNYRFAPDTFCSPIDNIIVMEDLKEQGYKMADKSKQLDFEHCRCYMKTAAIFHAMSIAVHKQNPELIYSVGKEKLFSNDFPSEQIKVGKNNIRYALECMSEHALKELADDRTSNILKVCSTTLWDQLVEVMQSEEELKSLSQGDPWLTNMMFKYNENGQVSDAILLDFQCLRWGSPADDLVFFIWSSANQDVKNNKIDELYLIYIETFNKSLKEMKLKYCLTMDTLKELILKQSPMALWVVSCVFPFLMNQHVTDLEPMYTKFREDYSQDNNPLEQFYDESFCKNHFPQVVQQLKTTGLIDYLEKKLR